MKKEKDMKDIMSCVASVPDPRRGNHRKHALGDMLFASLVSMMCGYDSYVAFALFAEINLKWLRSLGFEFRNGVPSHDAFRYAYSVVDHAVLSCCLRNVAGVLRDRAASLNVPIDGKALRRGRRSGGKTPYIVNAFDEALGLVLGEVKVDDKSNEIAAIPRLLELLDLKGCIVTVDAAGCQKKILKMIVEDCKAHAILALKDNQKTLHDEMLLLFETELSASPGLFSKYETPVEKNSGRIERRTCWQTDRVGWFEDIGEWPGLNSVIMVEAVRSVRNAETGSWETSRERRLYISSLGVDPKRALGAIRKHWGVERMHWTLDVTYGEDYCRARVGHSAPNRATMRRLAMTLNLRWAKKHKCGIKEAMMNANQSTEARLEMVS